LDLRLGEEKTNGTPTDYKAMGVTNHISRKLNLNVNTVDP